jgi:hypothetical protein
MNIEIDGTDNKTISPIYLHKMAFLYNALENGWTIKKKNHSYVFTKNHEGKKEVYLDDYLKKFMKDNFEIGKLLN